jgi:hypothetical protein
MRLDDGFPTVVSFGAPDLSGWLFNDVNLYGEYAVFGYPGRPGGPDAGVIFWEKRVKPPGVVGGGANDTTTMRNERWRTMNSKYLVTLSELTMTVSYDPETYDAVLSLVQINAIVGILWPDGASLNFYGFLDEFSPSEIREGEQPEAEVTVVPTNQDAFGVEAAPVYIEPT